MLVSSLFIDRVAKLGDADQLKTVIITRCVLYGESFTDTGSNPVSITQLINSLKNDVKVLLYNL